MKYFLTYIKKCQMGTYFLGWVYFVMIVFMMAVFDLSTL